MVVVTEQQLDQWAARRTVHSLGVGDTILDATERANPDLDWQTVVHSLDSVFLAHGGAMGQVYFLRQPQDSLGGRTPLDMLPTTGGPDRLREAARIFAAG